MIPCAFSRERTVPQAQDSDFNGGRDSPLVKLCDRRETDSDDMLKSKRFYWLADAISLVMLLTLRLPIDPRYIPDAEGSTLLMMLFAAFACLVAITRREVRLSARWLTLFTALFYLEALEAYERELEVPLQVLYLIAQVFIPRLPLMERPDDSVISPRTVTASSNRAAIRVAPEAALSKNEQWRQSLYNRDRYLDRWMLHLPKLHLPPVTLALLALNIAMFWIGWRNVPGGFASIEMPTLELFPLAANRAVLDDPAQWWRLLSSTVFHWSVAHLAGNMLMLYWLGRFLEPTLGWARFLIYYAIGSLFSAITAALALPGDILGAGASGGVYALIGVYVAFLIVHYRLLDVDGKTRWAGLLLLLAYMLYTSLSAGPNSPVSHAGHVGGLFAGIVLTLIGGPYFVALPAPDDPTKLIVYNRLSWRYLFRRRTVKPADALIR
jgi:rhomboid protease GluP